MQIINTPITTKHANNISVDNTKTANSWTVMFSIRSKIQFLMKHYVCLYVNVSTYHHRYTYCFTGITNYHI